MTEAKKNSEASARIPFRALEDGALKRLLRACGVSIIAGTGLAAIVGGGFQALVLAVSAVWILSFLGLSVWAIKLFLFDNNIVMGFLAIVLKINTMILMLAFLYRIYKVMETDGVGSPGPALLAGISLPLVILLVFALTKLPDAHSKHAQDTGKGIHG